MPKTLISGKSAPRGLTLVEVIVVTAIITVLVGLTALVGRQLYSATNRRSTEVILESLATATDRYRTERGYWPWEEYTRQWEVELTRRVEPGGGTRDPYFIAGHPALRERAQNGTDIYLPRHQAYLMIYDTFGMVQNSSGGVSTVERGVDWNEAGQYQRGAVWGDPTSTRTGIPQGIRLNLPNSTVGLANQGMPVFQSAGPDGTFSGTFRNNDDVFSHCGAEY